MIQLFAQVFGAGSEGSGAVFAAASRSGKV